MRHMTPEERERYDNWNRRRHASAATMPAPAERPLPLCRGGPFDGQSMAAPETGSSAEFNVRGWRGKYVLEGGALRWRPVVLFRRQ